MSSRSRDRTKATERADGYLRHARRRRQREAAAAAGLHASTASDAAQRSDSCSALTNNTVVITHTHTHTHTQPARRPPTNSATGSRVSQFVAGGPLAAWLQRRRQRAFQTFPAHGQHRRPRRLAIDSRDTGNMSARRDVNSALPDSRALYHTFHRTKSSDDDLPPIAGLEK